MKTLADEIIKIIKDEANNNPAPKRCIIKNVYPDDNVDILMKVGNSSYIIQYLKCVGIPSVDSEAVVVFIEGDINSGYVICNDVNAIGEYSLYIDENGVLHELSQCKCPEFYLKDGYLCVEGENLPKYYIENGILYIDQHEDLKINLSASSSSVSSGTVVTVTVNVTDTAGNNLHEIPIQIFNGETLLTAITTNLTGTATYDITVIANMSIKAVFTQDENYNNNESNIIHIEVTA